MKIREIIYLILILGLLGTVIKLTLKKSEKIETYRGPEIIKSDEEWEISIKELYRDQNKLEVAEVEFEYWNKQIVAQSILDIPEGSVTWRLKELAPAWVTQKVLASEFNQSVAEVIIKCNASVEFEVDKASEEWNFQFLNGILRVYAPPILTDTPRFDPETLNTWVVEEDFFISSEDAKKTLETHILRSLKAYTNKKAFKDRYREKCRSQLQRIILGDIQMLKPEADIRSVQVIFTDELIDLRTE
ncbi:MAG: hypothetical protein MK193_13670 [Lentisphaeria bacterium]|nr:hypothetical protein [Lentisphaeria bacterium]